MNIHVEAMLRAIFADRHEVEIVERKGLGHPDTLCDALAEELKR
jgi:S-adenosylmethionine synthetase